jgi:hypothetical protein
MRYIHRQSPFTSVLADPGAVAAVRAVAPEVLDSPVLKNLSEFPVGPVLSLILGDDARVSAVVERLAAFEDTSPQPPDEPVIIPSPEYEPASVARGSASVEAPQDATTDRRVEIVVQGPSAGNPFVDVELTAVFSTTDHTVSVGGFYADDGRFILRFLPPAPGTWTFTTTSTARSLDGITGTIQVVEGHSKGPTFVADGVHFAYRDGSPYVPLGTTAYAWTHQDEDLQQATLETLATAPFNKLRMCLFPKHFMYNSNEPARFVFERGDAGGWDTTRFDLDYFDRLERRLDQLDELGVVADLILFHPYDRWGFSRLSDAADDRYVTYVTRRLSSFANVWWSMANEYDLLLTKTPEDWDRLARIVQQNDHVGHPISIHNWVDLYDYSADWVTHVSIQRGDYEMGKRIDEWRRTWGKPVLVDEFGYEGNLDQGWGNLTTEEVVRRFWDGSIRGGYLTHGETYHSDDELIWWSKGGTLHGSSAPRLAFLREVIAQSPTGRLDPLTSDWDVPWGGVDGEYMVLYLGDRRPAFRNVDIPSGVSVRVDVIDTWDMTVRELPGVHSTRVHVDLPSKPYMAIRMRAVDGARE